MAAAAEDLQPLVEGGVLLLEQDYPFLKQAEPALLCRGVVAGGGGQDGPGELLGDALQTHCNTSTSTYYMHIYTSLGQYRISMRL